SVAIWINNSALGSSTVVDNDRATTSITELSNYFSWQCTTVPFQDKTAFECAYNFLSSMIQQARKPCQPDDRLTNACMNNLAVYAKINSYNTFIWDCHDCFQQELKLLWDNCYGMTGGYVDLDSVPRCHIKFEIYSFQL
ncbi:hypothetical protein LINGRAHAP2_LOCUS4100, partial [Linum grandiflorum]